MDNKENTIGINEFDFNLICEYFSSTKRQGPGSAESTVKALSMITPLPNGAKVADIGCGTGSSAIILAKTLGIDVTALDLFPRFIQILKERALEEGVADNIIGVVGSMDSLPFDEKSLDLIWCEGAIYNIGFERGLNEWTKLLKDRGYLAVTEPTWLTDERPEEIEQFWNEAYAEIETMPNKVQKMMNAGLRLVASFVLPDECWTSNYYVPQQMAQKIFLEHHSDNKSAMQLVENQRREAQLYAEYKQYYGYVFYIGQKI